MIRLVLFLQLAAAAAAPPDTTAVEAALVAAVRARMGEAAEVRLEDVHVPTGFAGAAVHARLDPGARLGQVVRFNLARLDRTTGEPLAFTASARATVRVAVEHLHARHEIARGAELTAADVAIVRHDIDVGALEPWPGAEVIGHSRAARRLPAGACLGRTSLVPVPAVHAGQVVDAVARVGAIEAVARLVAADRGHLGDIIRVVNPESRRSLRARVVASGTVEVIP